MEVKVFKVDETDWVAARTKEEAVSFYEDFIGGKLEDPDLVHELSDKEMGELKHYGVDHEREVPLSFKEELEQNLKDAEIEFPCHFASTEY